MSATTPSSSTRQVVGATTSVIGTVALLSAVPPFATDMYTPAFPLVTESLHTTPAMVGMTLTVFFLSFGFGQLVGGPISDQRGRRSCLLVGSLLCALGGLACAFAPSVGWLMVARALQGIGGGVAAATARAVVVDVARGDQLARVMSVLQALGGLAPMVAPVVGALVITWTSWRAIFVVLAVLGLAMLLCSALFIPETLPREARHGGGLGRTLRSFGTLLRNRRFTGFMLTSTFSGFAMMAYVANSSYVLQSMKGMRPIPFSLFFASTALMQVVLSMVNARMIGTFRPVSLIKVGLVGAAVAVAALTVGVGWFGTPLVLTCAGFLLLMSVQAFIFGNAGALAAAEAPRSAGAAAAIQGVCGSLAMSVSAPLASSGGATTAVPMVGVMLVGLLCSVASFALATHAPRTR